jgi:hypothetical protein
MNFCAFPYLFLTRPSGTPNTSSYPSWRNLSSKIPTSSPGIVSLRRIANPGICLLLLIFHFYKQIFCWFNLIREINPWSSNANEEEPHDANHFFRSFAIRNSHFDVLTTYNDTSAYLEIPEYLSAAADPENPVQYGGFSEHLMMMIGEVFRSLDRFERMTEIYLVSIL